jgi:hypothetical protein
MLKVSTIACLALLTTAKAHSFEKLFNANNFEKTLNVITNFNLNESCAGFSDFIEETVVPVVNKAVEQLTEVVSPDVMSNASLVVPAETFTQKLLGNLNATIAPYYQASVEKVKFASNSALNSVAPYYAVASTSVLGILNTVSATATSVIGESEKTGISVVQWMGNNPGTVAYAWLASCIVASSVYSFYNYDEKYYATKKGIILGTVGTLSGLTAVYGLGWAVQSYLSKK